MSFLMESQLREHNLPLRREHSAKPSWADSILLTCPLFGTLLQVALTGLYARSLYSLCF